MALQIIKENTSTIWRHSFTDNSNVDLFISSGWFRTISDKFIMFSNVGGAQRSSDLSDIEVIDETDTGTPETFLTALDLVTRLKELGYPYFK